MSSEGAGNSNLNNATSKEAGLRRRDNSCVSSCTFKRLADLLSHGTAYTQYFHSETPSIFDNIPICTIHTLCQKFGIVPKSHAVFRDEGSPGISSFRKMRNEWE